MEFNSEEIYLVAGATGECGVYLVKALLDKNKRVRLLIKNPEKLNQFSEEERAKFESVVICNLVRDIDYKDKLFTSLAGNVKYVISCLSYRYKAVRDEKQTSYEGIFLTNQRLIDAVKEKCNVKRFLLLSSTYLTKPYSWISLTNNFFYDYSQLNKAQTEYYLRNSGLNYLIVRPGSLKVSDKPSQYTISQGDALTGHINTQTVGKLAIDTLLDPWIPTNTTYECISYDQQCNQGYKYIQGAYRLKSDTDQDKQAVSEKRHIRACRVIKFGLTVVVISSAFGTAIFTSERLARYFRDMLTNAKQFLK
jgi:putative NADH-flavin reductase